jgi:hypothetical protein
VAPGVGVGLGAVVGGGVWTGVGAGAAVLVVVVVVERVGALAVMGHEVSSRGTRARRRSRMVRGIGQAASGVSTVGTRICHAPEALRV